MAATDCRPSGWYCDGKLFSEMRPPNLKRTERLETSSLRSSIRK